MSNCDHVTSVFFTKEQEIESNCWTDKELDEICEIVESAECAMEVFNDKFTSIESKTFDSQFDEALFNISESVEKQ